MSDETTIYKFKDPRVLMLCKSARTWLMLYRATGDKKYISYAKADIKLSKSLKNSFIRPLGVLLAV